MWTAPPLWLVALLRVGRSSSFTSVPEPMVLPDMVKRLTRLWIVGVVGGVVQEDVAVGREVRVDGDPQQPPLAVVVDDEVDGWGTDEPTAADDAHPAVLFGDEDPAVRREGHRGRPVETAGEHRVDQTRRCLGRGRGRCRDHDEHRRRGSRSPRRERSSAAVKRHRPVTTPTPSRPSLFQSPTRDAVRGLPKVKVTGRPRGVHVADEEHRVAAKGERVVAVVVEVADEQPFACDAEGVVDVGVTAVDGVAEHHRRAPGNPRRVEAVAVPVAR